MLTRKEERLLLGVHVAQNHVGRNLPIFLTFGTCLLLVTRLKKLKIVFEALQTLTWSRILPAM